MRTLVEQGAHPLLNRGPFKQQILKTTSGVVTVVSHRGCASQLRRHALGRFKPAFRHGTYETSGSHRTHVRTVSIFFSEASRRLLVGLVQCLFGSFAQMCCSTPSHRCTPPCRAGNTYYWMWLFEEPFQIVFIGSDYLSSPVLFDFVASESHTPSATFRRCQGTREVPSAQAVVALPHC